MGIWPRLRCEQSDGVTRGATLSPVTRMQLKAQVLGFSVESSISRQRRCAAYGNIESRRICSFSLRMTSHVWDCIKISRSFHGCDLGRINCHLHDRFLTDIKIKATISDLGCKDFTGNGKTTS